MQILEWWTGFSACTASACGLRGKSYGRSGRPRAPGAKTPTLLVQVFARRSRHGVGPALPSAALPHRGDRGLALAGSGGRGSSAFRHATAPACSGLISMQVVGDTGAGRPTTESVPANHEL